MSPEVWTEMKPLIVATAAAQGVILEMPNEDAGERPEPPAPWMSVDFGADLAERIELGMNVWDELGTVFLHVMIPTGEGVDRALSIRKAFSVAFRTNEPALQGLRYHEHSFDPMGADDGVYRRFSLLIRYAYSDITNGVNGNSP